MSKYPRNNVPFKTYPQLSCRNNIGMWCDGIVCVCGYGNLWIRGFFFHNCHFFALVSFFSSSSLVYCLKKTRKTSSFEIPTTKKKKKENEEEENRNFKEIKKITIRKSACYTASAEVHTSLSMFFFLGFFFFFCLLYYFLFYFINFFCFLL